MAPGVRLELTTL